jgi:hypothetical protein
MRLVSASRTDAKTGLLNAATWQREAAREITRAVRNDTPVAVAMLDIDHFKKVNDAYGHLPVTRSWPPSPLQRPIPGTTSLTSSLPPTAPSIRAKNAGRNRVRVISDKAGGGPFPRLAARS